MATNEDLWRLCTDWLTRCKVIPLDHKANAGDSEIKVRFLLTTYESYCFF